MANLLLSLVICLLPPAEDAAETYDVVVYGGTSAGVAAAVQASRMRKTVVIVSPDTHLGGLTTGGLGWTDSGRRRLISLQGCSWFSNPRRRKTPRWNTLVLHHLSS